MGRHVWESTTRHGCTTGDDSRDNRSWILISQTVAISIGSFVLDLDGFRGGVFVDFRRCRAGRKLGGAPHPSMIFWFGHVGCVVAE